MAGAKVREWQAPDSWAGLMQAQQLTTALRQLFQLRSAPTAILTALTLVSRLYCLIPGRILVLWCLWRTAIERPTNTAPIPHAGVVKVAKKRPMPLILHYKLNWIQVNYGSRVVTVIRSGKTIKTV